MHAQSRGVELRSSDRGADPCVDFYQFACGGWIAANPVPPDRRSWGRFQEVQDRDFTILRRILETPSSDRDREKASAYYAACLDESAIEQRGLSPLAPVLSRVDALASRGQLPALVAYLHSTIGEPPQIGGATRRGGAYGLFAFGSRPRFDDASPLMANVSPDGIALPGGDYYVKSDARAVKLRDQYRAHVAAMLRMAGAAAPDAARGADAVLRIETALATAMLEPAARRDPNAMKQPMTVAELQRLSPAFDWRAYFTARHAPAFDTLNVSEPRVVEAMNGVLESTSIADLKTYLRRHVLHGSAQMLPTRFGDETFAFFGRTLAGQQAPAPRWRECVTDVHQELGETLGKAFVEAAFGRARRRTC